MCDDIELAADEAAELVVSLCVDCARHPSLKLVIEANSVVGLCALCGRPDAIVRNPQCVQPMVMLIRALIRYYWDEHSYNSHWGGDGLLVLLADAENPIVTPAATAEYQDEFDYLLQEPPYPATDQGIAIYAGFDSEGMRHCNFAISRTDPAEVIELQARLRTENFHQVEPALESMIEPFLDKIGVTLPAGEEWFRARIGQKAQYYEQNGWSGTIKRQPWLDQEIGAPPPMNAGTGRLNRPGVSVLYLGSDVYTAIAEIRPHPGHYVSIGGFKSLEAISLADFSTDIGLFSANDETLHLYAIINALDRLMGLPVTPDEKSPYLLTQLLAEVLLKRGFDGVRFRSSVSAGSNICIFHPTKFCFVDDHSEVRRVDNVAYDVISVPSVVRPGPGELPIKLSTLGTIRR